MNIINLFDHTNLKKSATTNDILTLCDKAMQANTASVCIQPCYVSLAKDCLKNSDVRVCTVIGFPNGYTDTATKIFETENAIANGADEIDMVINVGKLKDKDYDYVRNEIKGIADVCHPVNDYRVILKVIVETCLLTDDEKRIMCDICIDAGADYIKTSTGFDKSGATIEDIKLMKEYIGDRNLLIKAAGGIRDMKFAEELIEAGAMRIGESALI